MEVGTRCKTGVAILSGGVARSLAQDMASWCYTERLTPMLLTLLNPPRPLEILQTLGYQKNIICRVSRFMMETQEGILPKE